MILASWDDYSADNLRLADLLKFYGLPGIFFVECGAPQKLEQIRQLAILGFEIGGHTFSHPADLKLLNDEDLKFEISGAKMIVENAIGKPVRWFAYPRGKFDERVKRIVAEAGFEFARTTRNGFGGPALEREAWHCFQRQEYMGEDWLKYLKEIADLYDPECAGDNNKIHIWGHANEISKNNEWKKLEELFEYLKLLKKENENISC